MQGGYSLPRNTTEGLSRRVRKDLDFIIKRRHEGEDHNTSDGKLGKLY
jgi:hypothetical protein